MKTNRDYFSYSQFALWITSPKEFYRRYVLGEPSFSNKYMRLGSEFMKALEYDEYERFSVIKDVPKLEQFERHLEWSIKVGEVDVKLVGIVDSISDDMLQFVEYKTGKYPWTQELVDYNDQILWYAYLIYKCKRVIPTAVLIHIETSEDTGSLDFTGNVYSYVRKQITARDLTNFENRIKQAIIEIEEYEYEEAIIPPAISEKYIALLEQKAALDSEFDSLKSEIMTLIASRGTKYADSPEGTFSLAERTNYKYSNKVEAAKKEVTKLQLKEKNDGTATSSTTSYLLFNVKKY